MNAFFIRVTVVCLGACTPLSAAEIETLAVVRELEEIEAPAKRDGLITELTVRRGVQIENGKLLARLDTLDLKMKLNVSLAELKHAEAKAKNDGPVDVAQTSLDKARVEAELLRELGKDAVYLERFRMENNVEKSIAELKSAKQQIALDELQIDVKRNESLVIQNDLSQTTIESPVTGIVKELRKRQGEWVKQGEPVAVITRMDKLLVEGFLDSRTIKPHRATGAKAKFRCKLAGDTVELDGLVVEDSAPKLELDGKFPVWALVDNRRERDVAGAERWLLRPGMTGVLIIHAE